MSYVDPRGRVKPSRSYDRIPGYGMALIGDKNAKPISSKTITPEVVKGLLASFGLRLFDAKMVEAIAAGLTMMNGTVPLASAFPDDSVKSIGKMVAAVETIISEMPGAIQSLRPRSTEEMEYRETMQSLLDSAKLASERLTVVRKRTASFWHDDADYLRYCLLSAKTSSGSKPSFTKPGAPAVKFIEAAFALAEIIHPTTQRTYVPSCGQICEALHARQVEERRPD